MMFKLNKSRSGRSSHGHRFSFHFSNFQVLQVPEGWEKLSVALVSTRTGKSIAKLGKEAVHNQSCQWTEELTESIFVSQDEGSSKEIEESQSLLKFVVTMGTTKTGILGEANVNLARYINSKASVPLSLPLARCDHRTILQLKIQCQTPRKYREDQKTDSYSSGDHLMEYDETEENVGSSSRNHMEHTNEDEKTLTREQSLSRSGSKRNSDSVESSSIKVKFSPQHQSKGATNNETSRQGSTCSDTETPTHTISSATAMDGIRSNSPFNSKPQTVDVETLDNGEKELENEISLLKESNAELAEQVEKTADSNAELLIMLQEMEAMVETQKADLEQLHRHIQVLEKEVEEKDDKIEAQHSLIDEALLECDTKWRSILAEREEEINILEEQITQSMDDQQGKESGSDFPQETEFLNMKLEELEKECTELVEENLQLVRKLKEAKTNPLNVNVSDLDVSSKSVANGDDFQDTLNELTALKTSMESLEAAYKVLERKSIEWESEKEELEQYISKFEKDNIQLFEKVSDLEARQRLLTDEKEECYHKLKHSKREYKKLRVEAKRLGSELEVERADKKQKLQEMQTRWIEAQEECEFLKKVEPKLQVTVSNLMDECNMLQNLNVDLKRQNKELQKHRSVLELRVNDLEITITECSSGIEALESEFGTLLEVMAIKAETMKSQLETLVTDNNHLKEKLGGEERRLNQMFVEKCLEVENLQKEIAHLLDQISSLSGGNAQSTSEVIVELCSVRAEKSRLEICVEELRESLASSDKKLSARHLEAEAKVVKLMGELSSSRQKYEVLSADNKKLKAKKKTAKSKEKNYKSQKRELATKFKVSEHERLQLEEEICALKVHQQKASQLQDDIVGLKNSLGEAKFEIKRLHTSFDLQCGDQERLMSERVILSKKVNTTEKALSELEDYKCGKTIMEEKISRLEADINAREELCAQDAEIKIELGRFKRANNELLRRIQYLEEDRDNYLMKIKASAGQTEDGMADFSARIQSLETELSKALEARDNYESQLSRFLSDEQTTSNSSTKKNGGNTKVPDPLVWNLQTELKDLRERYFEMSLKYADVEAQREELVMKLKSKNNKKGWFS